MWSRWGSRGAGSGGLPPPRPPNIPTICNMYFFDSQTSISLIRKSAFLWEPAKIIWICYKILFWFSEHIFWWLLFSEDTQNKNKFTLFFLSCWSNIKSITTLNVQKFKVENAESVFVWRLSFWGAILKLFNTQLVYFFCKDFTAGDFLWMHWMIYGCYVTWKFEVGLILSNIWVWCFACQVHGPFMPWSWFQRSDERMRR